MSVGEASGLLYLASGRPSVKRNPRRHQHISPSRRAKCDPNTRGWEWPAAPVQRRHAAPTIRPSAGRCLDAGRWVGDEFSGDGRGLLSLTRPAGGGFSDAGWRAHCRTLRLRHLPNFCARCCCCGQIHLSAFSHTWVRSQSRPPQGCLPPADESTLCVCVSLFALAHAMWLANSHFEVSANIYTESLAGSRINQDPYRVCVCPLSFRSLSVIPSAAFTPETLAW